MVEDGFMLDVGQGYGDVATRRSSASRLARSVAGPQEQQGLASPASRAHFKPLLLSHLLRSHWTEQVTWLGLESRGGEKDSTT